MSSPKRAPFSSISSGRPLRPWKMFSASIPTDFGQLGVQPQPLVVAVDRHHVARLGQVEHQLQLLLPAVAGGVDRRVFGGDHGGADLVDAVDRLVDRALVAGHRRGREDDRVAGVQLDVAVVVVGHPPQRRERLALAAGRDHDDLLVGEVLDLARLDEEPLRRVGDPEVGGDVEVLAHRAADQRDPAVELHGGVDHLLDAVDVGGEGGDDDPALAVGERSRSSAGPTLDSDGATPGRSALVESPQSSSSPSRPSSASREMSAGRPSTGVWSNL